MYIGYPLNEHYQVIGIFMINTADRRFLHVLSRLVYCNPFHPGRLELEREALGDDYQAEGLVAWSKEFELEDADRANVTRLTALADQLLDRLHAELQAGAEADAETLQLYQDLVLYVLYYRHVAKLKVETHVAGGQKTRRALAKVWQAFLLQYEHYLLLPGRKFPEEMTPEHLFACLYQLRRAFRFVFENILGDSRPAANLRAMVWQSIFTHDMRRYRRALYGRMCDLTTLIAGSSGTGKELVARAIGLSQYIAFDPAKEEFSGELKDAFLPVNLAALSPTLIESELFGHCRGAFTGAVNDRRGWLETCPRHGAVFLDEIGELDPTLQVKLLRVVQSGDYSRIGESKSLSFCGKLVTATNRDLAKEIFEGRFREDLYYRLCSDTIRTPSLRKHLDDSPAALGGLISFIARGLVGEESSELVPEVQNWIEQHVGLDYAWPGNIRELEQCVRNVLVRQQYQPQSFQEKSLSADTSRDWLSNAEQGTLTFCRIADQLLHASLRETWQLPANSRSPWSRPPYCAQQN